MQRLDSIISQRSEYSRSETKRLIKCGEVSVDGEICKSCDKKFDEAAEIIVSGRPLGEKYLYLMMNKPEGVVCATKDLNEKTVIDILPNEYKNRGVFPAGRLDKDTTGLLILTNDGDFSHKIMSPNKKIEKYYIADTDKPLTEEQIESLKNGITLRDGTVLKSAFAENLETEDDFRVGIRISEGKYHQVKRMLSACGVHTLKLTRISIGALLLDVKLHKGECRKLSNIEIKQILFSNFN